METTKRRQKLVNYEIFRFINGLNPGISVGRSDEGSSERTVVGDCRFDNLSGSHLQSQGNGVVSRLRYIIITRYKTLEDTRRHKKQVS